MDEAGSVPLHRWLSFCRVLMLFHPRVGARNYASHLFGPTDLKPGWNAVYSTPGAEVPVHYIFIPIGSGEGKNTEKKPDVPDSEIHDSYESDLPPFDGSLARRHLLLLGEMLVVQNIPDYGAAQLQETTAAIDAAAQQPLRGPTASVDERIGRDLGRLKQAIQSGQSLALARPPDDQATLGQARLMRGTSGDFLRAMRHVDPGQLRAAQAADGRQHFPAVMLIQTVEWLVEQEQGRSPGQSPRQQHQAPLAP